MQRRQIGCGERLVPQHRLPFEAKQSRQIEARATCRGSGLAAFALAGRDPGPQPQPRCLAQAAGEQQGKTSLRQQGCPAAHQAHQGPLLQFKLGRCRLLQHWCQLRRQTRQQSQLAEHPFKGAGGKGRLSGTEGSQGKQQAGIGGWA